MTDKYCIHDLTKSDTGLGLERANVNSQPEYNGFKGAKKIEPSIATDVLFRPPSPFERIIGKDDRVRIFNTSDYPFRMMCKLSMRYPGSDAVYAGSGALIGKNIILTAAHNLYDRRTGIATEITCSPGQASREEKPFGTQTAQKIMFPEAHKTDRGVKNDYGVIILDEDIGQQVGWFGYAAASDNELQNAILRLTGYPGDGLKAGNQLWHHQSQIMDFTEDIIRYEADTFGGNSGGPIYVHYTGEGFAGPQIFGIHTYGTRAKIDTNKTMIPEHNGGRRIDSVVLEDISEWCKIAEADEKSSS